MTRWPCLVLPSLCGCFVLAPTIQAGGTEGDATSTSTSAGDDDDDSSGASTSSTSSPTTSGASGGSDESSSEGSTSLDGGSSTGDAVGQRRVLTLDLAAADGPHDDFPLLVRLDPDRIDYDATLPGGQDLRFRDAREQLIPHEVEAWNPDEESWVWVLVPRIDVAHDHIFMDFGEPDAEDVSDPAAVWSPRYAAVWHMRLGPGGDAIPDSGPNEAHLQFDAAMESPLGAVGPAVSLAAADELVAADVAALAPSDALTVESWIRPAAGSSGEASAMRTTAFRLWTNEQPISGGQPALDLVLELDDVVVAHFMQPPQEQWTFLAGTFDGGPELARVFIDDLDPVQASTAGEGLLPAPLIPVTLGTGFGGALDEVRIATQAFSPEYLRAQYLSITDQLLAFGEP